MKALQVGLIRNRTAVMGHFVSAFLSMGAHAGAGCGSRGNKHENICYISDPTPTCWPIFTHLVRCAVKFNDDREKSIARSNLVPGVILT